MNKLLSSIIVVTIATSIMPHVSAESNTSYTSDTAYWEAKKIESQNKSTQMRKEYYEKYKSKWYDLSLLTADIMDGTKTDENKFWEALKQVQNLNEMPGRKEYVAKLSSKWIDVSGFTDTVMNDSGKFWTLANKLYAEYEQSAKKEAEYKKELEYKKQEEYKKELESKKQEEKKYIETKYEEKKVENKPTTINKIHSANIERAKKIFIQNLDKIPVDKRDVVYQRVEKNIIKQLEISRKRWATLLTLKLEAMLVILQSKMNEDASDESIVNSLFTE